MQEREIVEVEQGTSSSENIDGVYTLSITGEDLEAAIEQVEENKTNIEQLQENFSEEGYVVKGFATVDSAITGINSSITQINSSITTINGQVDTLNLAVGNEGSLTKAVTTLQGAVRSIDERLVDVEESVSEENEFEDRVSSLEIRLNQFNSSTNTIEAYINSESESLATVKSEVERLNNLKVDEIDAPITLEDFYAATTNKLTVVTEELHGTEEEPEGLIENVSNIQNRLNYFNDTANTLEEEFEKIRLTIDEEPWESYTDEIVEPLADSIATLEDKFASDGYVTKGFSTLTSSIATLTTRVQNLEDTKYNSTFSSEITIGKKEGSTPAALSISVLSSQGKHIFGYKIYYYYVAQANPTWSKVFIPFDLIDKFTSETKLDSALGFSTAKSFNLTNEFNQEREYFSTVDFHFSNWNTSAGYQVKIETLYEHNLSQSSSSYYN